MDLNGNQYQVDFGASKAILNFHDETSLTFTITQKDNMQVNMVETVEIKKIEVRQQLFILTWKEQNGNTITQIQDYENGVVYSNWTLPGGEFLNLTGTLTPV